MRIGVLGTGMVGQAIARKLVSLRHDVVMGARETGNDKARAFARETGGEAGNFADAAVHGQLLFLCTSGAGALNAVALARPDNLAGKPLLDVTNPLQFTPGGLPSFSISNTDSLGEAVQRAAPQALVVKTLQTVNASVMVDPGQLPGDHAVFVCGNDAGAKAQATELLRSFGWRAILDLGDLSAARGTEQYVALWLRLFGVVGAPQFNIQLVRGRGD